MDNEGCEQHSMTGGSEPCSPWCTCLTLRSTIDPHLNANSWMTPKYSGVKFLRAVLFEILEVQLSDLTSGHKASRDAKQFCLSIFWGYKYMGVGQDYWIQSILIIASKWQHLLKVNTGFFPVFSNCNYTNKQWKNGGKKTKPKQNITDFVWYLQATVELSYISLWDIWTSHLAL